MIERAIDKEQELALIVRNNYQKEGIEFLRRAIISSN